MDRSIRRHQQAVARVRKANILATRGAYWYWPSYQHWKPINRSMMNEPGWWVHEMMMQPARIRARQLCRLVMLGQDPDQWRWPDGKKPHLYYW